MERSAIYQADIIMAPLLMHNGQTADQVEQVGKDAEALLEACQDRPDHEGDGPDSS